MNYDLEKITKQVFEKCRDAAAAIMTIYEKDDFEVIDKSDNSPLTTADLASNQILCDFLQQLTPNIPIISEENAHQPYEERQHFDYCWLVDPLDGTKEFVNRNPEFSINVALVLHGRAVAGVVFSPCENGGYMAWENGGSWKCFDENIEKMRVSTYSPTQKGLKIPISKSYLNSRTQDILSKYDAPEFLRKGSALKFMLLADGRADVYPRIGTTMEWDTAASQIIIEEAGGKLLQLETLQPVVYNKSDLKSPNFIAKGNEI